MRLKQAIYYLLKKINLVEEIPVTMLDAVVYPGEELPVTAYRYGRVVSITGVVSPKVQVAAGGTLDICSIPRKYSPNAPKARIVFQGSSNNIWTGSMGDDGYVCKVQLERYRAGTTAIPVPTNAWLPFHFAYIMGGNV